MAIGERYEEVVSGRAEIGNPNWGPAPETMPFVILGWRQQGLTAIGYEYTTILSPTQIQIHPFSHSPVIPFQIFNLFRPKTLFFFFITKITCFSFLIILYNKICPFSLITIVICKDYRYLIVNIWYIYSFSGFCNSLLYNFGINIKLDKIIFIRELYSQFKLTRSTLLIWKLNVMHCV